MSKKISELPVATALVGSESLPIVQGGVTKKTTVAELGVGDASTVLPLNQFAATTSSQLAGVITDETGAGSLVFANSPALSSPTLTTPVLGVATATSITLAADPTLALQAATKQYVDGIALNLGKRQTVRAATTANITIATALNNADTLDGVALVTSDLVLVKNQTAQEQNGIYIVGVSPARFSEFATYDDHPGALIAIQEGTANADTVWLCTSNVGGTIDVTALVFSSSGTAGSLLITNNLSDVANAATARTNLGAAPANPLATDSLWDAAGDLAIGTGANTAGKLAITVPAANILNVLGVVNGETTATWKAVHDGTAPSTQAFGDSAVAGTALTAAHRDHKHAMPATPVTTIRKAGDTLLTGAVTLTGGTNVTLTQSGQDISIASSGGAGNVAADTIWDAAGDLVVGSGANTAVKLPIGTAYQVLRTKSDASTIEWGSTVPGIVVVPVMTANSAAANAAIIAAAMSAATEGTTLQFPEGTFLTTTITVTKRFIWRGVGREATVLRNDTGTLFAVTISTGDAGGMSFQQMSLRSDGGHVIDQTGRLSLGAMTDCYLVTTASGMSCWYSHGSSQLLLDYEIYNCEFEQTHATSGPLIKWVAPNALINTNTIRRCRFTCLSTGPAIYIECSGAGDYLEDLSFIDLNFETADYGVIHLYGVRNAILYDVRAYDTATFQDHVFKFHLTTGENCNVITLINSGRVSGGLAGGKNDVYTAAPSVVAINCLSNGEFLSTANRITQVGPGGRVVPQYSIANNATEYVNAAGTVAWNSADTLIYTDPLTADRTITPSLSYLVNGQRYKIVRATTCTGAFKLFIGTAGALATLSAPGWVEITYSSTLADFYVTDRGTFSGAGLQQSVTFHATTMSVNFSLGTEVTFGTLTANVTAMSAPSNIPASGTICRFYMLQDGTGGRTFTWHSKFVGTTWPTGSGTANQKQIVTGISDGTNIVFQGSSGWFTAT